MRIDSASRFMPTPRPAPAPTITGGGFAAMIADQAPRPADGAATPTRPAPDFTQMSRSDLFNWMNGEIRSGAMTLDESSAFLGMTIHIPVDGEPGGALDTQPVDFVALAQGGVEGARARHDDAARIRLESALAIMRGGATPRPSGTR